MKKRIPALLLMLAILIVPAAAAQSYQKQITVDYGISLEINGKAAVLQDPNGKTVQPFAYEGTTYVPIRAVADNLGAVVGYNAATNSATVSSFNAEAVESELKISYLYFLHEISMCSSAAFTLVNTCAPYGFDGTFACDTAELISGCTELVHVGFDSAIYTGPYKSEADSVIDAFTLFNQKIITTFAAYESGNSHMFETSYNSLADYYSTFIDDLEEKIANVCGK